MIITDDKEMRAAGAALAPHLQIGDLIILSGPLGAGKTTWVQGLGPALGITTEITSPTFVIARFHPGPVPLIHVDAYRLRPDGGGAIDPYRAVEDLDLDLHQAVTVIEWGDDLGASLSQSFLQATIAFVDDNTRELTYRTHGPRWSGVSL